MKSDKWIKIDPMSLTVGDIHIIHKAIKLIDSMCDGAIELDGAGFNKTDSDFGHSLASQIILSRRQAVAGLRMIVKYKRQLPSDVTLSLQSILEGRRIGVSSEAFDIIPEFFSGVCARINVVDNTTNREVLSFCPSQWDEHVEKKLLDLGLKKLDMKQVYDIMEIKGDN